MESRFDEDFSSVRIHTGGEARRIARAINAGAFTAGSHIAFGGSACRTQSSSGRELIAHELAHVVQQRGGSGAVGAPASAHVHRIYTPLLSEAIDAVGELVDDAGNFIAE